MSLALRIQGTAGHCAGTFCVWSSIELCRSWLDFVVLPNFELDDRLEWDRADRDWDCRPELAHEVMELPP